LKALLDAIYADPASDEARLVYADHLQERGDPRGELITLQIERARAGKPATAREKELLRRYGNGWLAELAPAAVNARFERGFVAACRLGSQSLRRTQGKLGAPAWNTVEELEIGQVARPLMPAFALQDNLRALRALRGQVFDKDLDALARAPRPLGIESLQVIHAGGAIPTVAQGLPALRRLRLTGEPIADAALARVFAGPGRALQTLAVTSALAQLTRMLVVFQERPLEELRVETLLDPARSRKTWAITLRRRAPLLVEWLDDGERDGPEDGWELANALRGLPTGPLEVRGGGRVVDMYPLLALQDQRR
jgi:uncharacterized protein (TIGR02996 family)